MECRTLTEAAKPILIEGKAIIQDPIKWGKNAEAYDIDGEKIRPTSDKACCWCPFGALNKARFDGNHSYKALNSARRHLANAMWPVSERECSLEYERLYNDIAQFNDQPKTTHENVMKAFDIAISGCN